MASKAHKAQLDVNYGSGGSGREIVLEQSQRATVPVTSSYSSGDDVSLQGVSSSPDGTVIDSKSYFMVFGGPDKIAATSGSVALSGKNLYKEAIQYMAFDGRTSMDLRYPIVKDISIQQIGVSLDPKTGDIVTSEVTADIGKRRIVSDIPILGIFKVTFLAKYDLYLAAHSVSGGGGVIQELVDLTKASSDDDIDENNPIASILVVAYVNSQVAATLTLSKTAPASSQDSTTSGFGVAASNLNANPLPAIKLEILKTAIQAAGQGSILTETELAVFPPPSVGSSFSRFSSDPEGVWEASKDLRQRTVTEYVPFSGQATAKLKYAPSSLVSLSTASPFSDIFSVSFNPWPLGPGSDMNSVEWLDEHTYKSKGLYKLAADEVGILRGSSGMPCYGTLKAEYSVNYYVLKYRAYGVVQSGGTLEGPGGGLGTLITVTGSDAMAGSLTLPAPNYKGHG